MTYEHNTRHNPNHRADLRPDRDRERNQVYPKRKG